MKLSLPIFFKEEKLAIACTFMLLPNTPPMGEKNKNFGKEVYHIVVLNKKEKGYFLVCRILSKEIDEWRWIKLNAKTLDFVKRNVFN